jgi:hypothetical protein
MVLVYEDPKKISQILNNFQGKLLDFNLSNLIPNNFQSLDLTSPLIPSNQLGLDLLASSSQNHSQSRIQENQQELMELLKESVMKPENK